MPSARFLGFTSVAAVTLAGYLTAQQNISVKVKSDEIGGLVSSADGVEAGVWVIAETTDLPTRYIKEVVTDDQGRYLIPVTSDCDLYSLGARLWAGGFAETAGAPGKTSRSEAVRGAGQEGRRAILPGELLVRDAAHAQRKRIPRHGAVGKRHFAEYQNAGTVAASDQDRQLRIVPPARQSNTRARFRRLFA